MNKLKLLPISLAAVLTAVISLSSPIPAFAVGEPDVLIFSYETEEDYCTDPDEEDADIADAIVESGLAATVNTFDGGDGSPADWSDALEGIEVLVFPEGCNFGTEAITDESMFVIGEAIVSGGLRVVGTGSYTHEAFVSFMTGLDYSDEFYLNSGPGTAWPRVIESETLPDSLPPANYAGGLENFSEWTCEKQSWVTPIYYNSENDSLAVGLFEFGAGSYVYLAYDWYPNPDDVTSGARDAWNSILGFAISGEITTSPSNCLNTTVDSSNFPVANGYRADNLGSVYFAPGSSKLSKAAQDQIKAMVTANPSAIYKVTGYVQKSATKVNDAKLSLARARAVESYLNELGANVTFTVVIESGLVPSQDGNTSKARRATLFAMTPVVL